MLKLTFSLLLIAASLILSGCKDSSSSTPREDAKVFQYSGALQCQPGSGTSLNEMQMALSNAGIDTVCAHIGSDGMNYPAVCGEGDGEINIYQIRMSNLEDAENLGYASVMSLPEYRDQACIN